MRVFVTGGAGYIGSHIIASLAEQGHVILAYDNLSSGHRESVLSGELVVGDLGDIELLQSTLDRFKPDAVMHFAAFIQVGESVREPLKYYRNNAVNTLQLVDAMVRTGVRNLIFSSTAALYGNPTVVPIPETAAIRPINPYGSSKAFVEQALQDITCAADFRFVALRYFNASGADPLARIGERHDPETHLIPLVLKAAAGKHPRVSINGIDYPTADGTCIRDYIHVMDLAEAHILALQYIMQGGRSEVFNCGYGHGYSVRQVIDVARTVTGIELPVAEAARREGDPPILVAETSKIRRVLGWAPRYDDLSYIVKTAWMWERSRK